MNLSFHYFSVIKVVPCEIMSLCPMSFIAGTKNSFRNIFHINRNISYLKNMELCHTAERIYSACSAMNIDPYIRVTHTSENAGIIGHMDLMNRFVSEKRREKM